MAIGAILGQTMNPGDGIDLIGRDISIKLSEQEGNGLKFDETGALLGGAGKRTCRFVVGTSTAGWTQEDCDYLCDGTADDTEINAAIQALPSGGGEIIILDGTYNITNEILINKDNIFLTGNNTNTKIQINNNINIFNLTSNYCKISSFYMEKLSAGGGVGVNIAGNNNTVNECYLINFKNHVFLNANINKISINNNMFQNGFYGVKDNGSTTSSPLDSIIINNNNFINMNQAINISFTNNGIISNNIVNNCSGWGVSINGDNDLINGNIIIDTDYGIYLNVSCDKINVSNNIVIDSQSTGIMAQGKKLTISSNTIMRGNGSSSDYTSNQKNIWCFASDSIICCNSCNGKAVNDSGSNNTVVNNKV